MKSAFKSNQKGFSLVELMAVVAIIGILAVIGIPKYQAFKVKAIQAEAKTQLAALHTAQHAFFLEYQGYHTSLKVIGYAPHGRVRYNIGFGSAGPVPPTAPVDTLNLNTKTNCGGPYGTGVDTNCSMTISTPEIGPELSTTASTYRAAAYSFDELLVSENQNTHSVDLIAALVLGHEAQASQLPEINGAKVDGWFIDQNNRLMNEKFVVNCVGTTGCTIGTAAASE